MGTLNLDSLNVNKRANYSSYNTAVDLLTPYSQNQNERVITFSSQHDINTIRALVHSL
jgi:hypothetical protein